MIDLNRINHVPGSTDIVGGFFAVNESERKRFTVSTWRCSGRFHVLGYTLNIDGTPVLVPTMEADLEEYKWPETEVVPEDLSPLSLEQFLELVVAGHLTFDDIHAQNRLITERKRVTMWAAHWEQDEMKEVLISCQCREGYYPAGPLLSGEKKITVDLDKLNPRPLNGW